MDKDQKLIDILSNGGIAIIPTDTIYGVVGKALDKDTVERIYKVKKRTPEKPFITLISCIEDLNDFGIILNEYQEDFLNNNWPGSISIILTCMRKDLGYLHRGTDSLAFRLPGSKELRKVIQSTGPLVAPSANPEGEEPAITIKEAKKYFKDGIDHYVDGGNRESLPSTLVLLKEKDYQVLREGIKKITE